jgi:hypothetical protein
MTDTTTTTPPAADADLVASYADADRAGKARIRATTDADMRAALRTGDIARAIVLGVTLDAMVTTKAPVTVDYAATIAQRAADLYAAADALVTGMIVPDGMPEGVTGRGVALPDASDAFRAIASAKVTRATDRADIAAAIVSAVSDTDAWLTMTDVARKMGLPSAGAVAARLFPTDDDGKAIPTTVPGVVTGLNAAGRKAVRKA